MCRLSGEEKWYRNSWLTHIHVSHYNINIQSGCLKTLEHVSACRLMFGPYNTLPFSEGWPVTYKIFHSMDLSYLSYCMCPHFVCMYLSVYVAILKSCIMELRSARWNRFWCRCRSVVTLFHWDWSYWSLFYEINNGIDTRALHCQSPSHPKKWLTGNNDSSIMALFSICSCQGFTVIRRRLPVRLKPESWGREWASHALSRL